MIKHQSTSVRFDVTEPFVGSLQNPENLHCYEEKYILSIIADWTPSKWRELSIIASTSENKHRVSVLTNVGSHHSNILTRPIRARLSGPATASQVFHKNNK